MGGRWFPILILTSRSMTFRHLNFAKMGQKVKLWVSESHTYKGKNSNQKAPVPHFIPLLSHKAVSKHNISQ